ncbi:MAG: hypothetical protein JXO22_11875, partial [Phycisphaerae bacterium]|nr:hypothetical protein [Phycisphaerae bacterium]
GTEATLRDISGLRIATSTSTSDAQLDLLNELPPLVTPIRVPTESATAFHRVFGLQPAAWNRQEEVTLATSALRDMGWSERVTTLSEERVSKIERQAYVAFKRATAPNAPDRIERLAEATCLLRSAHQLNRGDQMLMLLSVHAALEGEQLQVAVENLYAVAERGPDVFRDRRKLAEQFGDFDETSGRSAFLDRQMQRYIRIGESNANSTLAETVQAYCAWVLGQDGRARAALDRAVTYAAGRNGLERVEVFQATLSSVLE